MNIAVFNGGGQVDYMFGLVSGLAQHKSDSIDVLDVDLTRDIFIPFENVTYYPVFRVLPKKSATFLSKGLNTTRFYFLQIWYLLSRKKRIIHFQWLDRNKFADRVVLPLIARARGHKVVLTVHNINAGKRDNRDSRFNRLTLKILYKLANRLIVHTAQSRTELLNEFVIRDNKVAVIKHGMNNRVMLSGITKQASRQHFGIQNDEKVILFFGNIDYYKGLDLLVDCLKFLPADMLGNLKVLIAGNSKSPDYTNLILEKIKQSGLQEKIIHHIRYIPDEDVESYFMAADCIVLPYRNIYQSGVIFMAYAFGLPLIVSDIGNFRNDIVEGTTGFLIEGSKPEDLSATIVRYFDSDIYHNLEENRELIKKWAWEQYSWEHIGVETRSLYQSINR